MLQPSVISPLHLFVLGTVAGSLHLLAVWAGQQALGAIATRRQESPGRSRWWAGVVLLLVMAFLEELIFRRLIYWELAAVAGAPVAAALSALLFSLLHFLNGPRNILGFLNIFFIGIVYAAAFHIGGLALVTGLHFGWNLGQWSTLGYPLYGRDPGTLLPSLWQVQPQGDAWLSGGTFGAEASLMTTAATFILFVWLWNWAAVL